MFEGLNSPSIHVPTTLSEFSQITLRYSNIKLWGGGTQIMSEEKSYPSRETPPEVISLGAIEELKRITRNDRMIEIGSFVSLDDILKTHRSSIPEILKDNIEEIGSPLLTSRATLGGSIAASSPMSTIPATLITLGANCEIRTHGKKIVKSKWTPLSLLVSVFKNGQITLPKNALITRVRIALQPYSFSYFKEVGSYIDDVENTVAVSFTANDNQETLQSPHLAITFPMQGIIYSKDLDNILMQLHFPVSSEEFEQFLQISNTFINSVTPNITKLQRSRLNFILEDMINTINTKILASSTFESGVIQGN